MNLRRYVIKFLVVFLWSVMIFLSACQSHLFIFQDKGKVEAITKEETIDIPQKTDILFVIDNSGSMGEEQQTLEKEIIYFVKQLYATPNDFRIAVTSTDNQTDPNYSKPCQNPDTLGPVFIDGKSYESDKLHNGRCGRFLAPKNSPYFFLEKSKFNSPEAMAEAFRPFVRLLGIEGTSHEQPLQAAVLATSQELTTSGGPNDGFFRNDSLWMMIIMTDESDCSYPYATRTNFKDDPNKAYESGLSCYQRAQDLIPVDTLAQQIKARRGQENLVAVGTISAAIKNQKFELIPSACRIDERKQPTDICSCFLFNGPNYCPFHQKTTSLPNFSDTNTRCNDGTCCTAYANNRILDFAKKFKNYGDTICQESYSKTLLEFADIADRQCFDFNKVPLNNDPKNIQIKMKRQGETDDVIIPMDSQDGWYYEVLVKPQICLTGKYKRKNGDTVKLFVVSDAQGDTSAVQ